MERIPILKMGGFLLVSIQVDMHDRLAMQLQEIFSGNRQIKTCHVTSSCLVLQTIPRFFTSKQAQRDRLIEELR